MLQPQVTDVVPLSDYRILLSFETGEKKILDVTPYIRGDWFGKLKDTAYFRSVHVVGRTVEWAGGQDIAPHDLYGESMPVQ